MLGLAEWHREVLTVTSIHGPAWYLSRNLILKRVEKRAAPIAQGLENLHSADGIKAFNPRASPAETVTSCLNQDLQGLAPIKNVHTYSRIEMRVRHLNPKL